MLLWSAEYEEVTIPAKNKRKVNNKTLFEIAIKLINKKSNSKVKQNNICFLLGGKADIIIPPISAPKPSTDTIIPVKNELIENFSIIRMPIKERNGRAKILNNGVRTITVIKVEFFETSKITLVNSSKEDFFSFDNRFLSFSNNKIRVEKKYKIDKNKKIKSGLE